MSAIPFAPGLRRHRGRDYTTPGDGRKAALNQFGDVRVKQSGSVTVASVQEQT